jgi:hypothetical protein
MSTVLVVPSMKISGGNHEALRLVADLQQAGTLVISMWDSPHPMESPVPVVHLSSWAPNVIRAAVDLIPLMLRFAQWLSGFGRSGKEKPTKFIFTHYSTLPLAFLVPKRMRFFFVQGVEWRFTSNPFTSSLLKRIIFAAYRSGQIITANRFLTGQMEVAGLTVAGEMPIWAAAKFRTMPSECRDIDYVMVLRKGEVKRLDLYRDFIARAVLQNRRIGVITPEDEVSAEFAPVSSHILLRPTAEQMRDLYARSRCFIHLSDHEGFGLPPLEAMGAGCVPVCRDSGGIRAYLCSGFVSKLVFPKTLQPDQFFSEAEKLIGNASLLVQYSQEVQRIFDAGLIASKNIRRNLADALR